MKWLIYRRALRKASGTKRQALGSKRRGLPDLPIVLRGGFQILGSSLI